RRIRLLGVLRARGRSPRARDVHESKLPADVGRCGREELSRLGPAARPSVPRAQALVPDPGAGSFRTAGALAPRSRAGRVARGAGPSDTRLARARARGPADRVRAS